VMMAYKGRHHIDTHNALKISFGMIVGIFISVFILSKIHFEYLGLVFGVFILLSVLISISVKSFTLNRTINIGGGIIAGIMGTMAAVGGQILALLYQNHPLDTIRATLASLYTVFSLTMLFIFYIFDKFSYEQMISGFYLMPGFIIGYLIAPLFSHLFNPVYSRYVVLTMATLVQQAVDAAIRLSNYTREEAYGKGLINKAIDLEVQLLQEVADNGKTQENRDRAKRTINQLLWNGGRRYVYKAEEAKVAA